MADDITNIYGPNATTQAAEPQREAEQTVAQQEQAGVQAQPTPDQFLSRSPLQQQAQGIGQSLSDQGVQYQGELDDKVQGRFASPGTPGEGNEAKSLVADYYGNPAEQTQGPYGPETNQPQTAPQTQVVAFYGASNPATPGTEYEIPGAAQQPANEQTREQESMEPGT